MDKILRVLSASGFAALALSHESLAQTCSDNSGNSPYVCVDWGAPGNPNPGQDFEFNFTDPDKPGVQFITGDAGWVVWSQVSSGNSSPAALGDVTIDPSPSSSDSYIVKIHNAGTNGAGATTCGSINLTSSASGWTGHTAVNGGAITGNLTGDIKVKKVSGVGRIVLGPPRWLLNAHAHGAPLN